MIYKVGDKVRIKSINWYNEQSNEDGVIDAGGVYLTPSMKEFCGRCATITENIIGNTYKIREDRGEWLWSAEMFEGLVGEDMVNSPAHYNQGEMECIDAMVGAYGREEVKTFCKINAFKYLWRLGHKDAEEQEIGKIRWYLDKYEELTKN